VVLGIDVALAWIALQTTLRFADVLWLGLAGYFLPDSDLARYGREVAFLRLLQGGFWILTAVVFLWWLHRTYRMLGILGAPGLTHTPRQAVATFLVPGVNLVRPLRVMREVWTASHHEERGGASGAAPAAPVMVTWWWALLLLSVGMDLVLLEPLRAAWMHFGRGSGLPLLVLGESLRIAAGVLAIAVVTRINGRLCERLERGEVRTP
jgi:hypothetical protein